MGDLAQTLLEAYYCRLKHGCRQIVACLTDVSSWHFMKCSYGGTSLLSVNQVSTVRCDEDYSMLMNDIAGMLLKGIEELQY